MSITLIDDGSILYGVETSELVSVLYTQGWIDGFGPFSLVGWAHEPSALDPENQSGTYTAFYDAISTAPGWAPGDDFDRDNAEYWFCARPDLGRGVWRFQTPDGKAFKFPARQATL